MGSFAIRNLRMCTKDCLCHYVCPTGATDTEDSVIDAEKCIGCGVCAQACPSGAISMMSREFPPQQPKEDKVCAALLEMSRRKADGEKIALQLAETAQLDGLSRLMRAVARSERIVGEDLMKEAGFMLPQSANAHKMIQSLIDEPPTPGFPVETAKELRRRIPNNEKTDYSKGERTMSMVIKTVKFRSDGFYSQPFAFGGEDGMEKFDPTVRYRGSLQNYLIDTGDEVILVDTGLPAGTPEEVPDETSLAYTGKDISSYMEAFAALGYKPEQVTKILLTHRHADHSGELRSFPNAKIYVNEEETSAAELQGIDNIVPVKFTDGAYYNFPESQKIRDGIYYIKAKGHTNGNSIIIVENDGLFYMFHGDITYVDEALYADKLSVVFDDLPAARVTQDRVREFVRNHPTVYCGTHTPQGYENLEARRVMDLDHPVETVLAEVDFSAREASGRYVCSVCGYVYDPAEHDGVAFEDLPEDWRCPRCKQPKEKFNKA